MQTEDVFRNANEHIAAKAGELDWRSPVPFLCECSDRDCYGRIELELEAYDGVRSHPQRYLTMTGHEVVDALMIQEGERVAVVEKVYASAN